MTTIIVLPNSGVSNEATTDRELPKHPVSPNGDSDQKNNVAQVSYVATGPGEETNFVELPSKGVSDARPDPKPRQYPQLWQSYLWWYTLMELRKAYTLRISSIERGKSSLDVIIEKNMAQQLGMVYLVESGVNIKQLEKAAQNGIALDLLLANYKKVMVNWGSMTPVWEWVTAIKGLGEGGLAAQLIAQIDDIRKFDTVASLWRFAGYAVIEGKAEKNQKGEKSRFNRKLKGVCFNIADQFIKQQTPGYVDIYYTEKARQRGLYPEPVANGNGKKIYTDAHIHNRAWRKMVKAFLRDLWVEWQRDIR